MLTLKRANLEVILEPCEQSRARIESRPVEAIKDRVLAAQLNVPFLFLLFLEFAILTVTIS